MSGRGTSTLFTVGTLLRRAQDKGISVRALIDGVWVEGVPVAADSMGVILDATQGQVLVRMDLISAVAFARDALEEPVATPPHHEDEIVWAQPSGQGTHELRALDH